MYLLQLFIVILLYFENLLFLNSVIDCLVRENVVLCLYNLIQFLRCVIIKVYQEIFSFVVKDVYVRIVDF